MKPLWKNMNYICAAIFALLLSAGGVLLAILMMMTVDAAIEGEMNRMLIFLGLTAVSALAEFGISFGFRYFTLRYTKGALVTAKNSLYAKELEGVGGNNDDNIAMYSTNTDVIHDKYYLNHVYVVLAGSQFVFSVVTVIYLNWILFLVSFGVSMLPIFAPVIFQKALSKAIDRYSNASKKYIDFVQDSYKGVYEIKSFFAQKFFCMEHLKLNANAEKARASNRMIGYMMDRASSLLGSYSFVATIGVSGFLVVRGQLTVGVMIAVIQLLNGMVSPIGTFFTSMGEISASKELVKKYFGKNLPTEGVLVSSLSKQIELKNVHYAYHDNADAVINGFSACFQKGRSYALVGESGCGKSTLAKLIAGLLKATQGEVLYDDADIASLEGASYGGRVRYIDQDSHLFDFSVQHNIELGNEKGKVLDYMASLGLGDIDMTKDIANLSGGQKQRVVVARSLNNLPDVLILDEPTASLDLETALLVVRQLNKLDGLTLIIITHTEDDEMLALFDEVIRVGA